MHVAKSKRGGKKTILNKKNPSHSKEKEVRVSVHESTHLSSDVLDTFITPPQPASLSKYSNVFTNSKTKQELCTSLSLVTNLISRSFYVANPPLDLFTLRYFSIIKLPYY